MITTKFIEVLFTNYHAQRNITKENWVNYSVRKHIKAYDRNVDLIWRLS